MKLTAPQRRVLGIIQADDSRRLWFETKTGPRLCRVLLDRGLICWAIKGEAATKTGYALTNAGHEALAEP